MIKYIVKCFNSQKMLRPRSPFDQIIFHYILQANYHQFHPSSIVQISKLLNTKYETPDNTKEKKKRKILDEINRVKNAYEANVLSIDDWPKVGPGINKVTISR